MVAGFVNSRFYPLLGAALVVGVVPSFFATVELKPQVSPTFFFSSDSEVFRENLAVQKEFPSQQQILLNVATEDIADPDYLDEIERLSEQISTLRGVEDVYSVTNGPDDLEAARENPLWRRLLIGNKEKSTFIIAFVEGEDHESLVDRVEAIVRQHDSSRFEISISGLPYIVEQIRRNLSADMKTFTAGAVVLSALVLLSVFRSIVLVAGALVTCMTAAMLTLVVQSLLGLPIGILTANLGAIVFVLAQSHLIFLVANWCNAARKSEDAKLEEAISHTLPASFWAMVTTTLGFASLIFVEAEPLNQLGTGGVIGTLCAFLCAYLVFPAFLRTANIRPSSFTYTLADNFPLPRNVAAAATVVTVLAAGSLGAFGILSLDTDPSLLSYFEEDSKLYSGIYRVDKNGGSNPLSLVVARQGREPLDNDESYELMWKLQKALAKHESVGSVISLPVVMAEGDEHWLGRFLPWNILLDILSKPEFGAVAKSFVNEDRTEAVYVLRMKETGRERDRVEIVEEIQAIPPRHGFEVTKAGGTYYLQGKLAASVAVSMASGISTLVLLFAAIAFLLAGSASVALAVALCAASVAAIVLGTVGVLRIPVDIISSPSVSICLGLIVDDMIHLTVTARRQARGGRRGSMREWRIWRSALNTQSWPALVSTITIMIGFAVFGLSDFPPSQRFGLEIVYGAGLAVLLALVVFPYLAGSASRSRPAS